MYGYYYYDYTYFLFMLPALAIAMYAQVKVKSTFTKYSRVSSRNGLTGVQAAQKVLEQNGVFNVSFDRISGNLTDNYDPRTNVIHLSEPVYGSASVAALGVAAHEAGHAVQQAQSYGPIKLRQAMVPVTRIGSSISVPLIIIGMLMPVQYNFIITLGIILYSAAVLFTIITLPVEFNASARAIRALEQSGALYSEELAGAKKVLQAAALTYVAAALTSILTLLRFILILNNRRGND